MITVSQGVCVYDKSINIYTPLSNTWCGNAVRTPPTDNLYSPNINALYCISGRGIISESTLSRLLPYVGEKEYFRPLLNFQFFTST